MRSGSGGGRGGTRGFGVWSFGGLRPDQLNLDAGYSTSIHLDDGKAVTAKFETFASAGDEPELIHHETADRGISGIFGQRDVVLIVEVAHVKGRVENNSAVGKGKRLFDNVEFVVDFAYQ